MVLNELYAILDTCKEVKNRISDLKSADLVPIERESLVKEHEVDEKNIRTWHHYMIRYFAQSKS